MKALIFTEGGPGKGYGHVVRCSAVAAALLELGWTIDVLCDGPILLSAFFSNVNFSAVPWSSVKNQLLELVAECDALIFDSYEVHSEDLFLLSNNAKGISLFFDDTARIKYPSGILVNASPGAERLYGSGSFDQCQLCLGLPWQPMRAEFWDANPVLLRNSVETVLVSLGGDDIRGLAPHIHTLLEDIGLRVIHISTEHSRSRAELEDRVHPPHELHLDINASELLNLMNRSDLAISAGGQTSFELMRVGLPAIFVQVVDNQRYNMDSWREYGLIDSVIEWDSALLSSDLKKSIRVFKDKEQRIVWAKLARDLIDGQGARRIAKLLGGRG